MLPADDAVRVGEYENWKGNRYEVIGIAIHSETKESLVVYRALYGKHALFVRPIGNFLGKVERRGILVPRFKRIPQF